MQDPKGLLTAQCYNNLKLDVVNWDKRKTKKPNYEHHPRTSRTVVGSGKSEG
jgi:hypothetical protein